MSKSSLILNRPPSRDLLPQWDFHWILPPRRHSRGIRCVWRGSSRLCSWVRPPIARLCSFSSLWWCRRLRALGRFCRKRLAHELASHAHRLVVFSEKNPTIESETRNLQITQCWNRKLESLTYIEISLFESSVRWGSRRCGNATRPWILVVLEWRFFWVFKWVIGKVCDKKNKYSESSIHRTLLKAQIKLKLWNFQVFSGKISKL